MRKLCWTSLAALALLAGCQHRRPAAFDAPPAAAINPILATRPANDPSLLTLDQLQPPVVLPKPPATTRPAQAPAEAIQFYARGWAARRGGDRLGAIRYFEQALARDPDSFDINYAIGTTYLASQKDSAPAQRYLLRAAELNPDDMDVQIFLARQYQTAGKTDLAIQRLRLARQCGEYATRREPAALVDLFLARALRNQGYDTAALEAFKSVLNRLGARLNVRGNAELYFFLGRPETIQIEAGELYEKLGYYQQAVDAYQAALAKDSDNFSCRAHLVGALLSLKRYDQARAMAVELVSSQQASADSVDLLKDVYRRMGKPDAVADELRRLAAQRPADRAILFALADVLGSTARTAEAEALLKDALAKSPGDPVVVWRLFDLYWNNSNTAAAARLVIESLAQRPQTIEELDPLWARLVSRSSNKRLQLPMLQRLEVAPSAAASKLYWIARTAQLWSRLSLMRNSLEQAVAVNPPFPPAYRALLDLAIRDNDLTAASRQALANRLITQARQQSLPALAEELSGLILFHQEKFDQSADAFEKALAVGGNSPSVRYSLAMANFSRGHNAEGEAILQKVIEQFPTFSPAHQTLYLLYEQRFPRQAERILNNWLAADPFGITVRLVQVRWMALQNRSAEAQAALSRLFSEEPENPAVLMQMRSFHLSAGQEQTYLTKLQEAYTAHPENHLIASELAGLYTARKRTADAVAVLDKLRAAVKGDADQLYFVASLYQSIDRKQTAEQVLAEVLRIDPNNPAACNDLGYMWVEEGRNLSQAEAMLRIAVQAEPGNAAFLDSLGWLLYKRGKFDEAQRHLKQAVEGMSLPDAVVLDHLGDALYRLKQGSEALKIWRQALERIGEPDQTRQELARLISVLKQKIASQESGRPVDVAPLASDSQAKQ